MKILSLCILMGTLNVVCGQGIDYNTIILPDNAKDISIEEKLVQIAWRNNPNNHQLEKVVEASKVESNTAKWGWLDMLRFTGNINEFTLNPDSDPFGRAAFYPKYNFSASVPFSSFTKIPLEIKRSKIEVAMNEDRIKSQKLAIRAEVLSLYTEYKLSIERLNVQIEAEQTSNANMRLVEENFKEGVQTIQIYNNALQANTTRRLQSIEAKAQVSIAKIKLEEIIGVPLESVIGN